MDKKRILVVDDEPELLYMLKIRLEANNYEVITAGDGQEALQKARAQKPDLIMLDLMLPKLDGFKVCRMLKFDTKYERIPIIILTARTQEVDRKTSEEVGAEAYITKPFESEVLLSKIKELLEESKEAKKEG